MFRSRWAWPLRVLVLFLLMSQSCPAAAAGSLPAGADPLKIYREAPKVSVLTMGPGRLSFEKFGHNAIRVIDPVRGTDRVYNYGTFSFGNDFVGTFLKGRLRYWLGVSSFPSTLSKYKRAGRALYEQKLNLPPEWAHKVKDLLEENAKPENRYYLYDYYADNCSTRVRDLLDSVLGGRLEQAHRAPSNMTERDHTLRHVADDLWLYTALDFALGPRVDGKITRWDELFLPLKLRQGLTLISFQGAHGGFGLAGDEKVWAEETNQSRIRSKPPERLGSFFEVGGALAIGFIFLGWEACRRRLRWARWALLGSTAVLGVVAGALGTVLCLLWAFSDHAVAYRNENILQCAPWALLMPWWVPGAFRSNVTALRRLQALALALAVAAALGGLLKYAPWFPQENQRMVAFFVPLWTGLFIGLRYLVERAVRDAERTQPPGDDGSTVSGEDAPGSSEHPFSRTE